MSAQMTYAKVLEELQGVIHNLHDLSAFSTGKPFRGIVISALDVQYRDQELAQWTIRIEPTQNTLLPKDPMTTVDVEQLYDSPQVVEEKPLEEVPDEEIRTRQNR